MKLQGTENGETRLETIISYLLITGVILSLCLEVIGIVLFHLQYHNFNVMLGNKVMFIQGQNFFVFLFNTVKDQGMANSAILFMTLGMATLILTPYIRVIASFIYFAWVKDFKYVLITAFVLVILTVSLTLH